MLERVIPTDPATNGSIIGGGVTYTKFGLPMSDIVAYVTIIWIVIQVVIASPKILRIWRNWRAGKGWTDE